RRRIQELEEELEECRSNAVLRVQDRWMLEERCTRLLNERNRLRARLENCEEELRRLRGERRREDDDNGNRDRLS
ncbi:17003_t:CDS:1, partial [Racocetra fulgida]